jgi:hypothetical protein
MQPTMKVLASHLTLAMAVVGCVVGGCNASTNADENSTTALNTTHAGTSDGGTTTDASTAWRGPVATSLTADLQRAGLTAGSLPALDSLDDNTRIKVMKTFTKALGVQCNFCHDTSDFSLPTPRKKIAARMWSDFVLGLQLKSGGAMYCDSCHGGKPDFLDRSSEPVLEQWMSDNFVGKLKRTDGADHSCDTCHGSPFHGDIFKDVWHAE